MSDFHTAGCSVERHRLIECGLKVKKDGELVQEPAATSLARFRAWTVEERNPEADLVQIRIGKPSPIYRCACCRAVLTAQSDQPGEQYWNERVLRRVVCGEATFAVHEVYYTDSKPTSCTTDPVEPHGETLDELRQAVERHARACDLPVLDYDDFER